MPFFTKKETQMFGWSGYDFVVTSLFCAGPKDIGAAGT
jgi:hypothetical protein